MVHPPDEDGHGSERGVVADERGRPTDRRRAGSGTWSASRATCTPQPAPCSPTMAAPARPSAHLAVQGQTHFLMVCPASVVINWTREIRSRSTLKAVSLHGPERQDAHCRLVHRRGRDHHLRCAVRDAGAGRARHGPAREGRRQARRRPSGAARAARRRRGALRQESRHPQGPRRRRLDPDVRAGAVPDRHPDGEPRGGVPQPRAPSQARTVEHPPGRRRGRRLAGLPQGRRPRLPAPQPAGRAHGTAGAGARRRMGGVLRRGPERLRRGQLHGHAPHRIRTRRDVGEAPAAALATRTHTPSASTESG